MQDAGCRVQGEGCRVQGAGCRVSGLQYPVVKAPSPPGFSEQRVSRSEKGGEVLLFRVAAEGEIALNDHESILEQGIRGCHQGASLGRNIPRP